MIDRSAFLPSALLLSVLSAVAPAGEAQEAAPATPAASAASPAIFLPDAFTQYSPRTALDMVTRVPGFAIRDDDDGSRGFGDARGNVLIDGQRVSGKSNGATGALRRLPASRVVRLELADGSSLGIAGLSGQVVNVITDGSKVRSGSWSWRTRIRENLSPAYHGLNATLSGGSKAISWSVEADSTPERGANGGFRIIRDGAGNLIEKRKEAFKYEADVCSLSGSLGWKPEGGAIGNLNGKLAFQPGGGKETGKGVFVTGLDSRRLSKFREEEWNGEIGADYEFALGPGRLKSIALARREHSPFTDEFLFVRVDGSEREQSLFEQTVDEGEYILREEYALKSGEGRDWQVSLEGAFNYLESEAALKEANGNGPLIDVPLTLADTRVEELRGDFALTHGRKLTDKLSLKVSLGAEMSEISQTGDAEQTRRFTRPKGYADLTFKQSDTLTWVARFEREVGQLDFFDFISSVDLNNDNSTQGNPDIVPQQAWVASLSAEKDLKDWGAFTLKVFAEDIEDIADTIPVGRGEGPGNLESAWRIGSELEATLKLTPLGFKGAELKISNESATSRVDDPVTGLSRRINGDLVNYIELNLRQDVPDTDWAWSLNFENYRGGARYRLNRRGHETANPGFMFATLEHKDVYGLNAQIIVGNLLNQRDKFRREIYSPNRAGALVRTEDRDARFGPVLIFTLKGDF